MLKKDKLFWGILTFVILVAIITVVFSKPSDKRETKLTIDKAVATAQDIYRRKVSAGTNLSNGPCLTNDLMIGWVADIVHNPRQSIDDLPENQCQAYLEGRAIHFIELDLNGNLVRLK